MAYAVLNIQHRIYKKKYEGLKLLKRKKWEKEKCTISYGRNIGNIAIFSEDVLHITWQLNIHYPT